VYKKPIVTAGYLESTQYLCTDTNPESYAAAAILKALRGHAPKPIPHFWEENIGVLREAYSTLQS